MQMAAEIVKICECDVFDDFRINAINFTYLDEMIGCLMIRYELFS